MKKIFTLSAALLLFVSSVSAQTYFNVGSGCCFEHNSLADNARKYTAVFAEASHNFNIGNNLGVEAGIGFMDCFNVKNMTAVQNSSIRFNYSGLMVPVQLNCKLGTFDKIGVSCFVGPRFHYGLTRTTTTTIAGKQLSSIDAFEKGANSRFMATADAGVAAEYGKFRIKADYQYGLNNTYLGDACTETDNFLTLSLGYRF